MILNKLRNTTEDNVLGQYKWLSELENLLFIKYIKHAQHSRHKADISIVYFIKSHNNFKILYHTVSPYNKFPL